jgi:hypothetical protein
MGLSTIGSLEDARAMRHSDGREAECPWCGSKWEPEGGESGERSCEECGGTYELEVDYDVSYTTIRVPFGLPRWVCVDETAAGDDVVWMACDSAATWEGDYDATAPPGTPCVASPEGACGAAVLERADAPCRCLGGYDEPAVYLCDAEPIPATWEQWTWPAWVPPAVIEAMRDALRHHTRTPRAYLRDAEASRLPLLGEVVSIIAREHKGLSRLVTGRWVWDGMNTMGSVVTADGAVHRGTPLAFKGYRAHGHDRVRRLFRGACRVTRREYSDRTPTMAARAMGELEGADA